MKKQKAKVYLDRDGSLLILKDRLPANAHDRIYLWEVPQKKGKTIVTETLLSPGKAGFKCLGAL